MWTDRWNGKTIGLVLADAARCFSDKPAMVFENGTLTFQQLLETSAQVAKAFLALGVDRGDRVAPSLPQHE